MAVDNDKKIMRGEFRGDFTRDTFDPMKAFSRVLMQQGRVQLDADWNEQVSILLHGLRNFNCDIGGPHWGPKEGAGFTITITENEDSFTIGAGHYYVNGILCELEAELGYEEQVNYPVPENLTLAALLGQSDGASEQYYLVYLDVWERHISFVEDNALREVALGGPDTATRAQIIWQVKLFPIQSSEGEGTTSSQLSPENYAEFLEIISEQTRPGTGKLSAKLKDKPTTDNTPCLIAPDSRYRGLENQLYRVEIHHSVAKGGTATFKWSRDNGAVIFPVTDISGSIISLGTLGQDCRSGLKANDWVELIDDDSILRGEPGKLVQIVGINSDDLTVTVNASIEFPEYAVVDYTNKHVILRRWDHNTGDAGIPVTVGDSIDLEDGIQIQFPNDNGVYQTGDYWLIPARTATDAIEWPENIDGEPKDMLPHGVIHHYAPLAIFRKFDGTLSSVSGSDDGLRRINKKELWELA